MSKILTILRGIPGCGKSTVAEYLAEATGAVVCTADDFFVTTDGNYEFVKDKIGFAHHWCKTKCKKAMEKGLPVIVANTSTTESELEPYFMLAKEFDYKVFCLVVENRHGGKNVHDVPEETIEKMIKRFNIKL